MKLIRNAYALVQAVAIAAVLLFAIAGCATTNQAPQQVLIPVEAQRQDPQLPERPYLPVRDLAKSAPPDEVLLAYAVSVSECRAYAEKLETILHAYKTEK